MSGFDLKRLIKDVFAPVPEDIVTVMRDVPHGGMVDNDAWAKRRLMAEGWREGFIAASKELGFKVNPLLEYQATGGDGANLPEKGVMAGKEVVIEEVLAKSTIGVALTEFSPTAPLDVLVHRYKTLRCASMPHALKEMEETALSADYGKVAKMCHKLVAAFEDAAGAEISFSTGHRCYFDLRYRKAGVDDGQLPPGKVDVINLPSGEVFIAPYEGEKGEPSRTEGELAATWKNEVIVYKVKNNKITEVTGANKGLAKELNAYFDMDPARRNIAELGLGCNDKAIRRNNILEDEKAGPHWAYGLSDHLGGTVGAEHFKDPKMITHYDLIYAKGSPVTVDSITVHYSDGRTKRIWNGDSYAV